MELLYSTPSNEARAMTLRETVDGLLGGGCTVAVCALSCGLVYESSAHSCPRLTNDPMLWAWKCVGVG